jgi:hypothetical protein
MANVKFSQITVASSPPALTDQAIGVLGGSADVRWTFQQIQSAIGGGGGGGGTPGGVSGQVQYNNAGAFGGFTASGDAVINTGTGVITVSKTGGTVFAPSAIVDTTNAANISSGFIGPARLPLFSTVSTVQGAVPGSGTGGTNNYLRADGVWAVPPGSGGGTVTPPGGSSGQFQYNNAGTFGGVTLSGDLTANTTTGVVTVTKTGGTAFVASATTDTTNAANITTGTLPVARLPLFTSIANGAVTASGGGTTNFLRADGTWAVTPGNPGGTTGQIQYDNAGVFGGFTTTGDATINTSTGIVTVTKTGGTSFVASATTDTTNAANISSGLIPVARLPLFTSVANGAVTASGGGTTNFLRADNTWAVPGGGGGGGLPGGSSGQIQWNNSGAFGGFTASGDATINTSTGVVTVLSSGGTVFAASARVDTTNATNITTGTLTPAVLPLFSTTTTTAGVVPGSNALGTAYFLRADQSWAVPPIAAYAVNVLNNGISNLVNDGVTDNTAKLNTLLSGLSGAGFTTGARLYFPAGGKYFFAGSPAFTYPASNAIFDVTLTGDGQDATILNFASGQGMTFSLNSNTDNVNQSFHCEDMSITTNGTNAGTGIKLQQVGGHGNGDYCATSEFTRVTFRGDAGGYGSTNWWGTCLALSAVSNINVVGCYFQGGAARNATSGGGITYAGIFHSTAPFQFAVVVNVVGCSFVLLNIGFNYGDAAQGITFDACNFDCLTAINCNSASESSSQLSVTNCQFAQNVTGNCIVNSATPVADFLICNNLFLLNFAATSGVSSTGILLTSSNNAVINGNMFVTSLTSTNTNAIGVKVSAALSTASAVTISGNHFGGFFNAGCIPYQIAGTTTFNVANNTMVSCTSPQITSSTAIINGQPQIFQNNTTTGAGNYAFKFFNNTGGTSTATHGVFITAGPSGATDSTSVLLGFGSGSNTAPVNIGSITRDSQGISLNNVNNIGQGDLDMTIGNVSQINGPTAPTGLFVLQQNASAGRYAFALENLTGATSCHGVAVYAGPSAASDSTSVMMAFQSGSNPISGSTQVGSITRSGTGVVYNTTSDVRLKEGIADSDMGLALARRIPVRKFCFTNDPEREQYHGFVAQELHGYYPRAVHVGGSDPLREPWGVDYGRLTPLLLRAIQELADEVDTLKRKLQ